MANAEEAVSNNGPEAAPEAPNFEFDFDMGEKPGSNQGAKAEASEEQAQPGGATNKNSGVDAKTTDEFFGLMKTACAQAQHGYERLPPGPLQEASFRTVGAAHQVYAQCFKLDPERAHKEWTDNTGRPPTQKLMDFAVKQPDLKPRDAIDSLTTTVQASGTEVSLLTTDQRIQEKRKLCLAAEGPMEDAKARAVDNVHGAYSKLSPEVPSNHDSGMFLLKSFFEGKKAGHQMLQGLRQHGRAKAMLKDGMADRKELLELLNNRETIKLGQNKTDSVTPTNGPLGSASAMQKTGPSKFSEIAKTIVQVAKAAVSKAPIGPTQAPSAADMARRAAAAASQSQGMGMSI